MLVVSSLLGDKPLTRGLSHDGIVEERKLKDWHRRSGNAVLSHPRTYTLEILLVALVGGVQLLGIRGEIFGPAERKGALESGLFSAAACTMLTFTGHTKRHHLIVFGVDTNKTTGRNSTSHFPKQAVLIRCLITRCAPIQLP
jgi:hypothetical protein